MRIYYRPPIVTKDYAVVIEQVTEGPPQGLANGIQRKEVKIVVERYPTMELLKETIHRAEANYLDLKKQANKTVRQLEAEKKALQELKIMVDKLRFPPRKAPSETAISTSEVVESKVVEMRKPATKKPVVKKTPVRKTTTKKPTAKKSAAKKTTTVKKASVKKTTTRKPRKKKTDEEG